MITKNKSNSIFLDRNLTDLVKFLSCLMISIHHYSQGMVVAGSHNLIYQLFSTQGGWLGVAIFFFLSGYGLKKSDIKNHLDIIPFFKNRLLKTYFPAVLVSLLWSAFLLTEENAKIGWSFFDGIFWNFNDEVLWFVRTILKLYVMFYGYSFFSRRYPKKKLLIMLIVAAFALFWIRVGFVHSSSILLFFLGINFAENDSWYLKAIRKIYPVVALFVSMSVFFIVLRDNHSWIHLLVNYFLIAIIIVFVAVFEIKISVVPRWMSSVSYDTYLVHNKSLMLLRSSCVIVPFWQFLMLTTLFSIVFYYIRTLFKA